MSVAKSPACQVERVRTGDLEEEVDGTGDNDEQEPLGPRQL